MCYIANWHAHKFQGTPIIFVNVNYRLGPIGFAVGHEAEMRGALNLGLKDQLAALSWVQKHISAFGGDPTKVGVLNAGVRTTLLILAADHCFWTKRRLHIHR